MSPGGVVLLAQRAWKSGLSSRRFMCHGLGSSPHTAAATSYRSSWASSGDQVHRPGRSGPRRMTGSSAAHRVTRSRRAWRTRPSRARSKATTFSRSDSSTVSSGATSAAVPTGWTGAGPGTSGRMSGCTWPDGSSDGPGASCRGGPSTSAARAARPGLREPAASRSADRRCSSATAGRWRATRVRARSWRPTSPCRKASAASARHRPVRLGSRLAVRPSQASWARTSFFSGRSRTRAHASVRTSASSRPASSRPARTSCP